jgi:hypothetical protein
VKLEQSIQKRFIDIVTNRVNVSQPSSAHHVYSNLIFYRLKEIFEKSFPRFTQQIKEEDFHELIYDFIKEGATTPILWRVNEEFKDFVLSHNNLNIPYLEDLLNFEALEIHMHMQDYSQLLQASFALDKNYKRSQLTKIISLSYPVHHPEFDKKSTSFKKGEFFLLLYHKESTNEIIYEEITPFAKELLEMLQAHKSLQEYLHIIAEKYEVAFEDILEVYQETLEFYVINKILVH